MGSLAYVLAEADGAKAECASTSAAVRKFFFFAPFRAVLPCSDYHASCLASPHRTCSGLAQAGQACGTGRSSGDLRSDEQAPRAPCAFRAG